MTACATVPKVNQVISEMSHLKNIHSRVHFSKKSCTGFCEGLLQTVSYPLDCLLHCHCSLDKTLSFTVPWFYFCTLSVHAENVLKARFVQCKTLCTVKVKNPWKCFRNLNADFWIQVFTCSSEPVRYTVEELNEKELTKII